MTYKESVKKTGSTCWGQYMNQKWLVRNFEQYQDKWVILQYGELIGVADTPTELTGKFDSLGGVMITKV